MRYIPHLSAVLLLAVSATAQNVGGEWSVSAIPPGAYAGDQAGAALAALGDVDGDGVDDFALGAPGADPNGLVDAGSVFLYSGATGLLIRRFDGQDAGDRFGAALAGLGDLDGDGLGDLAVGVPYADPLGILDAGAVHVLSGADGTLLWKALGQDPGGRLGFAVAAAGNADGDGIPDVVAGAPNAAPFGRADAGTAFVYAGVDGSQMDSTHGRTPGDRCGFAVAGTGDLDGDGLDDVLVGIPFGAAGTIPRAGEIRALGPATSNHITSIYGTRENGRLGQSLSRAGDVDHDGYEDLLAGAPTADFAGRQEVGVVLLFSGADASVLGQWAGTQPFGHLGWAVSGPGDVNGDGTCDLLLAAPHADGGSTDTGRVDLVSGHDFTVLWRKTGMGAGTEYGLVLAPSGDADGNGLPGFLVGAPMASPGGLVAAGAAEHVQYDPFLYPSSFEVSSPLGGTVSYQLDFPAGEAGMSYGMLASASGTGPTSLKGVLVPLTRDGVFDRVLQGRYPPGLFTGATGILDADGRATAVLTVPPGGLSSFTGSFLYFAALSYAPPGDARMASGYVPLRVRR